jgi:O-antigen ligase
MVDAFGYDKASGAVEGTQTVDPADKRPLLARRFGLISGVFALLVQQGAFVSSPVISDFVTVPGSTDNVFNTLSVALNIVLMLPLCVLRRKKIGLILSQNKVAIALVAWMFMSVIWSLHPDTTMRREVNYTATILTVLYLVAEFDADEIMRIVAFSIGISAVFSFLFVVIFPLQAIHQASQWQGEELTGAWKGVFSHKNVLGHAMTIGVVAALYNLGSPGSNRIWSFVLLCACVALTIGTRSSTALSVVAVYLITGALYLLFVFARRYFIVGLITIMTSIVAIIIMSLTWSDTLADAMGRDFTLTGRTALWELVIRFIDEKPLLGWGYGAMWLPQDNLTIEISDAVGWAVPQAHNAFLEILLEIGAIGLFIVIVFILVSIWRGLVCFFSGPQRLGAFGLIIFLGVMVSGLTESIMVQNQNIEWVMFNIMSFCCQLEVSRARGIAARWLST